MTNHSHKGVRIETLPQLQRKYRHRNHSHKGVRIETEFHMFFSKMGITPAGECVLKSLLLHQSIFNGITLAGECVLKHRMDQKGCGRRITPSRECVLKH